MATKDKEVKKVRRPQAKKREERNQWFNLRNRAFRSQVLTAIRALDKTLEADEETAVKKALSKVHSLLDKGYKKGVFKKGKAERAKSRIATRVNTKKAAKKA